MSGDLKNIIEAILMVSDSPLSVAKIQGVFDDNAAPEADEIIAAIGELQEECDGRAIELQKIASGYRYQTKIKYADWIRKLQAGRPPRMSRALLETLAIIAYRQPVSRGDIEEIRGVTVTPEIMQRLLERDWVKQVGVRDTPGRPALFGTTPEFLSYFNLISLSDLPPLMDQRDLSEIAQDLEKPLPSEVLAALEAKTQGNEIQKDVFELSLDSSQGANSMDEAQDAEINADNLLDDEEYSDTGVLEPDAE